MNEKQNRILFYIIILISVLSIIPLKHLKFDFSIEKVFAKSDSDVAFFKKFREQFHADIDEETIIIGLENGNGIFQNSFLIKADSLTQYLIKLNHITKVYSLTNSSVIYFKDGQFNARPLIHIDQPEYFIEDSINLFNSVEYRDLLVSQSGKAIVIAANYTDHLSDKDKRELINGIKEKINQLGFYNTHLIAKADLESLIMKELKSNLILYVVLLFLIFVFTLYILYKSFYIIQIAILVMVLSIMWTLSLMTFMGYSYDVISSFIPLLLILFCLFNTIQFTSDYEKVLKGGILFQSAFQKAANKIGFVSFISASTAAIVFFSLDISSIISVKVFGLIAGIGVLISSVLSNFLLWYFYNNSAIPEILKKQESKSILANIFPLLLENIIENRRLILSTFIIMVLIAGYFITELEINGKLLDEIPNIESTSQDYRFIEEEFYGARSFEMALIIDKPNNSFLDISLLKEVEKVEKYLRDSCQIEHLISPISLFKGANKAYHGGNNLFYTLPESQLEITTYYGNIMQTQYADEMQRYLLPDASQLRISGRSKDIGVKEFKNVTQSFNKYFNSNSFSFKFRYQLTGLAWLLDKRVNSLIVDFKTFLVITALLFFLIGIFYLQSWQMSFIFMIPNFLSIFFTLGIMGITEIYLKYNMVVILSISLGFNIMNTIHFMNQFKIERIQSMSILTALKQTFQKAGKLILITTFVILLVFLSLMTFSLMEVNMVGLLVSINVFFSLILNLILLPLLLLMFCKRHIK